MRATPTKKRKEIVIEEMEKRKTVHVCRIENFPQFFTQQFLLVDMKQFFIIFLLFSFLVILNRMMNVAVVALIVNHQN